MSKQIQHSGFKFAPYDNRAEQYTGPLLKIFGNQYQIIAYGVYEIPEPIQGCMVKIIWLADDITAVVRDIATDHTTTLTVGHGWMGRFIQNQIRKYRGVSDYDYLRNTLEQDWLPEWLQGDTDEMEFSAMYETYRVIYSNDDTCWIYDSESVQSGLYPSTIKPNYDHFREWAISTIGHSTDEGE